MFGLLVSLILLIQGIPVQQGGTVTGILRDSQGMPLAGVRMAAVARGDAIEDAATGAAMAGLAETDERGRFTLENIPPGRYSIAAGRLDLQTYYPGTQSLADATILTISPGATLPGINFALSNTSFGRAISAGGGVPNITVLVPVRLLVEKGGKLPISANGNFTSVRMETLSSALTMPIDGTGFTVPGPATADFRVVIENLPDSYEVKSILYGSTAIPQGVFRLTAANFPTTRTTVITPAPPPTPPPPTTPPANPDQLQAYLAALAGYRAQAVSYTLTGTTVVPAATPPSTISITIGEVASSSSGGVRISGKTGSRDRRRVYISGKPGIVFSDGTFEFRGVQPGRHLIAAVSSGGPLASVVVVGDKDIAGIELKETFMLPADVREPKDPMPAGSYAPGTIIPFARVTGTVVEEISKEPLVEGNVMVRVGDYSRIVPIDDKGHFESFYLLPGTYDLRLQIFGHSTIGPTITVEDKDINLELTSRRLY